MTYDTLSDLKGTTLVQIHVNREQDEIIFVSDDGQRWKMFHQQDCCESVTLEEIIGDLDDLLNSPILVAEERTREDPESESGTWTFYELRTIKGSVTLRWIGYSNGFYSERVDFDTMSPYPIKDSETWEVARDLILDHGADENNQNRFLRDRYRAYFKLGGK